MTGNGGDGKSARTILRDNVFAGHHKIVGPDVFQKPDEFRIQGCHFANAKCITTQECLAGSPMMEDVWKNFVSGGKLAVRPLYGKSTEWVRWSKCGKFWENNRTFPSIKGDYRKMDKLKSFTRRLIALELSSSFTTNPECVDVGRKVFEDDPGLTDFLAGDGARLAYIKRFLIPFIKKFSPQQCIAAMLDPPERVKQTTRRVVGQMANGGLECPAELTTISEDAETLREAEEMCRKVHAETVGERNIKSYNVGKIKCLPGVTKPSRKSKSKLDHFEAYVDRWPHLFTHGNDDVTFDRLDIDLPKFEQAFRELGADKFGGNWSDRNSVWVCKELLREAAAEDFEHERDLAPGIVRTDVLELTEIVNITALAEYLDDASAEDPKAREAASLVERVQTEGGRVGGDYATIQVTYYSLHGIPGRWYARGPSAQKLSRTARRAAFRVDLHASQPSGWEPFVFLDVDINNCFATILWNLVKKEYDAEDMAVMDFPVFAAYKAHYRAWRDMLMHYTSLPLDLVKKEFFRILCHGTEFTPHRSQRVVADEVVGYFQTHFGSRFGTGLPASPCRSGIRAQFETGQDVAICVATSAHSATQIPACLA